MKKLSPGEETFAIHCRVNGLVPVRELRFCEGRKWSFDFAFPNRMIAVEIEGGTWSGGRHTRGSGYAKDLEKYNMATRLGWKVYRYTTEMVAEGTAIDDLLAEGI